jgi:uncharacterized protein (DUF4415 family)
MTENKSAGEKRASTKGGLRSHAKVKDEKYKRVSGTRQFHKGVKVVGRVLEEDLGKLAAEVAREFAAAKTAQRLDADDDAPELTEEFFARADLYHGDKLVRAGRPPSANPKIALKLRIDPDIVEHFRATGPGWQTRINDTLRKAAKLRGPAS